MTAEIFSHFVARRRPIKMFGTQSPTLLAQVCRQWRDVATSFPRLWSSFQLHLAPQFVPQQLNSLRTWLQRSGACPLSICLAYKTTESQQNATYIEKVVQELVSHCDRWHSVELVVPFDVLHLIHGKMPLLQALKIGPSAVPESQPQHPLQLFDSSPKLNHIVLSRCFQPSTIELRWENCTTLQALLLYPEECTAILRRTVNIVRFKAIIDEGEGEVATVPPLMHLQSLILLSGDIVSCKESTEGRR